ncbi:MAG: DUF2147 domain-containing protein [Cyclobacteriaceae bacterium]
MKALPFAILLILFNFAFGQVSIAGKTCAGIWRTVDDETGRTKSKVQIVEKGGKYFGTIIELLDPETLKDSGVDTFEEVVCDECPKDRGKDQPVIGLTIIWDMKQESDRWADGEIMDPENGKIYGCSLWLDEDDPKGNTLKVRGWLAFFYRTQTWYREN